METKNWFSAISLTLTMPDICGALETPNAGNGVRYKRWFSEWLEPTYTKVLPDIGRHVFLSADNCWALRCSYLHAGSAEIRPKNIEYALRAFHFIEPPTNGNTIHMNQVPDGLLQLQTDKFCEEMISAVNEWQACIKEKPEIQARINNLLKIHNYIPAISY